MKLFPFVALALSGCFIPVARDVDHPGARFVVTDGTGRPVEGAIVRWFHWEQPHSKLLDSAERATDAAGCAEVASRTESETTFPLMMHGVGEHHWTWCVEKDGALTVVGGMWKAKPGEIFDAGVKLTAGPRVALEFKDVYLAQLRCRRSADGRVLEPVVVKPRGGCPEAECPCAAFKPGSGPVCACGHEHGK
jgi:hypothetical protein